MGAILRQGLVALRQPQCSRRIAQLLWTVWAVVVWGVVFDHVVVVAGREYLAAAVLAAHGAGPYARMDDWMRPAVTRGLVSASLAAAVILIVGFAGIRRAGRPAARGEQRAS